MAQLFGKIRSAGWPMKISLLFLLILVVVLARWGLWETLGHRYATITEGRVYQSGVLPPETLKKIIARDKIRSVVDLRTDDPTDFHPVEEAKLLESIGVQYYNLPSEMIPAPELVSRFLEIAADEKNYPMLIHCHHGEGRSVLLAAVYRIEFEGWSNEKARKACRFFHFRGSFGPDGPKGKYLRDYKPQLQSSPAPAS